MGQIKVTGINRSNSHENAISHAGSLIVNARKKGDIWEFIGDKEDFYGCIKGYYTNLFWHHKLAENYIIAFNPTLTSVNSNGRRIDIVRITRPAQGLTSVKSFLQTNGLKFTVPNDEEVYSIHALNDIIIVDTDVNKYFFNWDDTTQNFLQLDNLPDLDCTIGYNENSYDYSSLLVNPISISVENTVGEQTDSCINASNQMKQKIENGLYVKISESDSPFWYSTSENGTQITGISQNLDNARNRLKEIMSLFISKLHSTIIENGYIYPAFRYIIAYELVDGTIIKISPVYDFIKPFPYDNSFTPTLYNFRCLFPCTSDDTDKNYYLIMANNNSSSQYYNYNSISKVYNNVLISLSANVNNNIETINKWVDLEILKSINVYITNPNSFIDTKESYKPEDSFLLNFEKYKDQAYYDSNKSLSLNIAPQQSLFFKFDEDALFDQNQVFYKIGSFDLKNKKTSFKILPDYLKNVVNDEAISIVNDLSKTVVSKFNNVYNSMIHKCNILNQTHVKDICADHTVDYNDKNYTDTNVQLFNPISLDVKINDKWWRIAGIKDVWAIEKTVYVAGATRLTTHSGLQSTTLFSQNISQINVVCELGLNSDDFIILKEDIEWIKVDGLNALIIPSILGEFKTEALLPKTVLGITLNMFKLSINRYHPDTWKTVNYNDTQLTALKRVDYAITRVNPFTDTDTNRMQLSGTDNPFIYPAARSYRYSDKSNIVVGAETSSVELSAYKYGLLPMYVFTEHGVWIMETAQGSIAYSSQHLIENIKCINNSKLIKRVQGGVVFYSTRGMNTVVGNTIKYIPCLLEGNVNMQCQTDIETATGLTIKGNEVINNIVNDFITDNSFLVHDKFYNELLLIDPSQEFTIVTQLDGFTTYLRRDNRRNTGSTYPFTNFYDTVLINNEEKLITTNANSDNYFYSLSELNIPKSIGYQYYNNNAVVIASTTLFNLNYIKLEHLIARFTKTLQSTALSTVSIFVLGSRDGIEWKIISSGVLNAIETTRGAEIRRHFISCRYFQLVFICKDTTQLVTDNRFDNHFQEFIIEPSFKDAVNKLR